VAAVQRPEQQSVLAVHAAPSGTHVRLPRQTPLEHVPVQQSAERVHVSPPARQLAWQTSVPEPSSAQMVEQQSSGTSHDMSTSRHVVVSRQRSTPVPVGRHCVCAVPVVQHARVALASPETRQIAPGPAHVPDSMQRPSCVVGSTFVHEPTPPQQSASV
jgi:hypothetical protein